MDGTPFGKYQLQKLLGRGGMGEVYEAYDTKTDRIVALKVLPHHLAADETFKQRFRRESQAAAGVNDPHVVPIHGFGEIDGRLYLDMRLIEGQTVGELLASRERPLSPTLAVSVVEQVATALDAAHEKGLIHRDVKPSNILLTLREFAYLIDFGLARTAGESGMTTAGNTLGTLGYMAPERFEGGPIDGRADIYALTCVLHECLTGNRPYQADSLEQQIAGHMMSPPPRPSDTDPKLAAFDEVIAKGMAKKPGKRYQTAAELAAAARRALNAPVPKAGRSSGRHSAGRVKTTDRPKVSRRAVLITVGSLTVVAVCAVGAWMLWGGPLSGDTRPASIAESSTPPSAPAGAVPELAASVPEGIRGTGRLVIGVNVPYAPNEFKDSSGELVGFDVDLMNAAARTLGLVPDYRETAFESILGSVSGGDFNVGMSSFTDTIEREAQVDFVDVLPGGHSVGQAQRVDGRPRCRVRLEDWRDVRIDSGDDGSPCQERRVRGGRAIANRHRGVHSPGRSDRRRCRNGEVEAMSADSPVTGFTVKLSAGELDTAGRVVDMAPYGWAVAKGSGLAEPMKTALEHLMKTGEYRTIATKWGVEMGMIPEPVINGAGG